MQLLLLSPYHGGSHQAWAEGYSQFSENEVNILALPARFWKWRMHGAAVTLARRFRQGNSRPDLIMATDMLDLTTFLSLTRATTQGTPVVLYMHENQLTYPLPVDKSTGPMRRQLGERDRHYAFINYASMLAADQVWFNSRFHRDSFFDALPNFLKHFPDYNELNTIADLRRKSTVMPVGIDLGRLDLQEHERAAAQARAEVGPLILWNQRWEYDKAPGAFFAALDTLASEGVPFRAALCGQQFGKLPTSFTEGIASLGKRLVHCGYAEPGVYARLLWEADIVVSTAVHEFFGISILEAIYAHTFPILPARLSYPELIPAEFAEQCLYDDRHGLLDRLRQALSVRIAPAITSALAASAAAYHWERVAPRYDRRLSDLLV